MQLEAHDVFVHVAGVVAVFVVPGFAADELRMGMKGEEGVLAFAGCSLEDGDVALEGHVGVERHDGRHGAGLVDLLL
jgi:hypothetical protein